ncbi:hypothetical protein HID58_047894 [Brassica napus]|uniref:Uncharacterized protein n=1 Tax=Brassica napus TaxID=3708 RepID=A0ABQ8B230_BRANA|nr:hypothetical protein HID58_047894 [Brassica napus]
METPPSRMYSSDVVVAQSDITQPLMLSDLVGIPNTLKFDHLQALANTNLELSDVVVQIRYVQGSDLNNAAATTRLVVRLLIEPNVSRSPNTGDKTVCNGGYNCESKDIRSLQNNLYIADNLYLNTIPATKFYFDTNLPAIRKFTARCSRRDRNTFVSNSNEQMREADFICKARIVEVLHQNGWPFVACTGCNRSWTNMALLFVATNAFLPTLPRFRVELSVDDGNDNATFVVFDMEKTKLTKRDASDLGHELNYQHVLKSLLERNNTCHFIYFHIKPSYLHQSSSNNQAPVVEGEGGETAASASNTAAAGDDEPNPPGFEAIENSRKRTRE